MRINLKQKWRTDALVWFQLLITSINTFLKQPFKKKYKANVRFYSLHGGKRFFLER